ncbi:MAG: type II toxin-antitoxin system VapC family toxin [Actinomycetota bacterium]|nr:type II toxin-antitoxin system VapC family toxin [Actinomycetota bacterium]MDQ6949689.1 type II toxin-antitoxin system VapC family toxin [Actinomycetota bacterium]
MILVDVNVLVYAHRADSPSHGEYRQWLEQLVNADAAFGLAELVLSGFVRVVTHPRVFDPPTPCPEALDQAERLRTRPNHVAVRPGARHWDIFTSLCRDSGAKGNLVPDAYLAALAIESGSEWVTTDRDYARFPGLRWSHPLKG